MAQAPRLTQTLRFVELSSPDATIRNLAAKAVQVLENPELSEKGRVRIIQDLQQRIAIRQAELLGETAAKKGPKAKPSGLGCPAQLMKMRESFKQAHEPIVKPPVKKVRLSPR